MQAAQLIHGFGIGGEFCAVAAAEFVPMRRIVAEPLAQFGAGRDVLEPLVNRRIGLGHAPRPEAIDQYPPAVAVIRRLVDALEGEVGRAVTHRRQSPPEARPDRRRADRARKSTLPR
ncbi:hypothetical protein D3C72_2137890 [compost metagenome]